MKNKKLITRLTMLFAFLLVTSTSFAQVKTEEDMAKAVFETIKTNNLETFSSYCATDERMTNLVDGMSETTPKEKGVKQELKEEKAANFRNECINKYNALIKELKANNSAINKGVFTEITKNKTRVEVTNLKASEIKFKASFNTINYEINIDIFKTKSDLFIYDFQFHIIESVESN